MKYILNADDYGKNRQVTDAIANCFAKGGLDRTTIMVSMPDADRAVAIAKEYGFADKIGLHLDLTEDVEYTNLQEEIERQVKKYLSYELPLMHCDGHKHSHRKKGVFPVLLPILKKYGFKSVRRPNNLRFLYLKFPHLAIRDRLADWIQTRQLRDHGFITTRYMDGYAEWKLAKDLIRSDENSETEIMLHPCYTDDGRIVNLYERNVCTMEEIWRDLSR